MLDRVYEGQVVRVDGDRLLADGELVANGTRQTERTITDVLDVARSSLGAELEQFAENTLEYIRKEGHLLVDQPDIPTVPVEFRGRHVLIVVRGIDYKSDLAVLRQSGYLSETRPLLIGVDGGADALLEMGHKPDLIIGDFDSVSERTLRCGAALVVHGYPGGQAPGAERLANLGLPHVVFESAGTSEDIAMLLAFERGAERHGWTVTVLDETFSDLGGYKDATLSIRSKGDSPDGVWSRLKFEGGVHRVQRVPVTESQGRVHTSAAGVLVYPEPDEVEEVQIDESDLRIDVYRSSGKGGQGVNTTDSAVRITHLPTGIVVTCQNERSQLQNKARAMQVLAARLQALAEEQAQADASADRASQIRTVDRSERIRTYNFPENRIADHRINFKAHNLDQVLDGDMDALFDALAAADKQSRLQQA